MLCFFFSHWFTEFQGSFYLWLMIHTLFSFLSPASQFRWCIISMCSHSGTDCIAPKTATTVFPGPNALRNLATLIKKWNLFPLLEVEWDFVILLMNKVWWKSSYVTEKLGPRRWDGFQLVLTGAPSLYRCFSLECSSYILRKLKLAHVEDHMEMPMCIGTEVPWLQLVSTFIKFSDWSLRNHREEQRCLHCVLFQSLIHT